LKDCEGKIDSRGGNSLVSETIAMIIRAPYTVKKKGDVVQRNRLENSPEGGSRGVGGATGKKTKAQGTWGDTGRLGKR